MAGQEAEEYLRVEGCDNHGVATSDDLPDIWEFLNELCNETSTLRLVPLGEMSRDQKETLLAMAVNDSKCSRVPSLSLRGAQRRGNPAAGVTSPSATRLPRCARNDG